MDSDAEHRVGGIGRARAAFAVGASAMHCIAARHSGEGHEVSPAEVAAIGCPTTATLDRYSYVKRTLRPVQIWIEPTGGAVGSRTPMHLLARQGPDLSDNPVYLQHRHSTEESNLAGGRIWSPTRFTQSVL